MIFPLENRQVIRGCQAHKNAGLGCGTDYVANFVPLYAPVAGKLTWLDGYEGGHWIHITASDGRRWEMAHLSARSVPSGTNVVAGQRIGTTGNSGHVTTGAHLHIQITKGSTRYDPEPLLANAPFPMAYDTSKIGVEGTLVRIGSSPLRYGYILRGKRYEYPMNDEILMMILPFEKFKLVPILKVTPQEWDTIPKSVGVKF